MNGWKEKFWKAAHRLLIGKTKEQTDIPHTAADTAIEDPDERQQTGATPQIRKATKLPFSKPMLFFSGWGFDERNGNRYAREYGKQVSAVTLRDGRKFALRNMYSTIVFRALHDGDERAALFLLQELNRPWSVKVEDWQPAEFNDEMEQERFGRILLYVGDFMQKDQAVNLCFAPDGSGVAKEITGYRIGSFRWQEADVPSWPQLLTAGPETLRPLCDAIFREQVNPRATNLYLIDNRRPADIPHAFVRGSEAELRRITTAIVQTQPGLFEQDMRPVVVTYRAQMPKKRGCLRRVERDNKLLLIGRIQSLGDLAHRLNTFTGETWKPRRPVPNRIGHYEKHIHKIVVIVHAPSAHERAESLLTLAEWLEGKVRADNRLRFLGLDEDI